MIKCYAKPILTGFILLFLGVSYVLYQQLLNYTIESKKGDIEQIIRMQKSIRSYVDGELKPTFYQLESDNLINRNYYSPKIFSATYIISHIFHNYFREQGSLGYGKGVHYRIASDNPLNLHHQATPEELKLLQLFRQQPNRTEVFKILHQKGHTSLFLARPVLTNTVSCLRCHGNPKQAPRGLVSLYGTQSGFHEKVGTIRGVLSYSLDLTPALKKMRQVYLLLELALFLMLALIYIGIIYSNRKIHKGQEIIEQQKEALLKLANGDNLTQLYNRHKLDTDLPQMLAALAKGEKKRVAAIFMDIDFFKAINDDFGHDVGDIVLQTLAQLLRQHCQPYKGSVYRVGGEEFLVLLEDLSEASLTQFVRELCADFPLCIAGVDREITLSIGVVCAEVDDNQQSLLKKADLALYYVKQHGRNNVHFYDDRCQGD